MAETFAWPEGKIYLYTGTGSSALVGYAENVYGTFIYGVDNFRTFDGVYHNRYTGQRVDIHIGAFYTTDTLPFIAMANAQTAVHMHLKHSASIGSAGFFLYSGAIDSITYWGRDGDVTRYTLSYHANVWSAY